MNNIRHPFHIHVNPCWVVKINGVAVEPYWLDTIPLPAEGTSEKPTSVTFRSRFDDFKGLTVFHCHMLAHEDMGMMQAVDIV
jgi:FtsP/CotA-like multicopper oxidase with cupredoxin domain